MEGYTPSQLPVINGLAEHGAENQCFLPESTEKTVEVLAAKNGAALYSRHVIPAYGHIDCIFGKTASNDVYPYIVKHLDGT